MFAVLQTNMDPSPGCGPSQSISPAHHPSLPTPPPLIPIVKTENGREGVHLFETSESDHFPKFNSSVRQENSKIEVPKSEASSETVQRTLNLYWQGILADKKFAEKSCNSANVGLHENTSTSAKPGENFPVSKSNGNAQNWSRAESSSTSSPTIPPSVSLQHLSALSQQVLSTVLSLQRLQQSNAPCSLGNLLPPPPDLLNPLHQTRVGPSSFPVNSCDTVRDFNSSTSLPETSKSNSLQSYQDNASAENDLPLDLSLPVAQKNIMQNKYSSPPATSTHSKKYYDESSIASIRSNFPTLLNKTKTTTNPSDAKRIVDRQMKDRSPNSSVPSGHNSDQPWISNQEVSGENDELYSPQIQLQKWLLAAMSVQKMQQIALGRPPPHIQDQLPDQDFPKPKRQKTENQMHLTYSNRRQQHSNTTEYRDQEKFTQVHKPPSILLSASGRKSASPSSKIATDIVSDAHNSQPGKRYRRYAKPPYSYVSLITLSILSSREKKLRLSQILKRISEMFPFFNGAYQGWRDSVRHNLSQNECFVKVLKNPYRPTAKGNFWTVNLNSIPHELLLRQNTLVSRYAQDSGFRFRKDLTEVFDLRTGALKVPVPRHLLKDEDDPEASMLSDDPAAVMEAILLEGTGDDDLNDFKEKISPDVRQFTLEDLFHQCEDNEDDSLLQNGRNRSRGKQASTTSITQVPRLLPKAFAPRSGLTGRQSNVAEDVNVAKCFSSAGYLPRLLLPKDTMNSHQLCPSFSDANPFTANQTAVLAKALAATQLPGLGLASLNPDKQLIRQHEVFETEGNAENISSASTLTTPRSSLSGVPVKDNRSSYLSSELPSIAKKSKRKGAQPIRHRDASESVSHPSSLIDSPADGTFCVSTGYTRNRESCTITFPSPKSQICGSAGIEESVAKDLTTQTVRAEESSSGASEI